MGQANTFEKLEGFIPISAKFRGDGAEETTKVWRKSYNQNTIVSLFDHLL